MKVGDVIYYANNDKIEDIEELIIKDITDTAVRFTDDVFPDYTYEVSIKRLDKKRDFYFTTYEKAVEKTKRLSKYYNKMEEQRKLRDDKYLDWALTNRSTMIPDVENNGTLLKEKWMENNQAILYEYNEKKYVVIYKHSATTKECVAFYQKSN